MLPPDTFSGLKVYGKCVCGWSSAPDPAGGACSTSPDPYLDLRGPLHGRGGGEGEEIKWRGGEGRGGKGVMFYFVFFICNINNLNSR